MEIFAGLLIGLVGSLHCVGMCGPLVLALPISRTDRLGLIANSVVYNTGRAFTYAGMGLLMGSMGWCIELGGLQKGFSILIGIVLLYSVLVHYKPRFRFLSATSLLARKFNVLPYLKKAIRIDSNVSAIKLGFLNGLLPCGLVYVALATSITLGRPLSSAAYMFMFGLGTIPLMVVVMAGGHMYKNLGRKFRKWLPLFTAIIGAYLIYRGLAMMLIDNPQDLIDGKLVLKCH